MTYYLSRDYLTQSVAVYQSDIAAMQLAAFLHKILGYTVVGQTNFNISTVGTLLIAQGTANPNLAGINQLGTGNEFKVTIPVAAHTVTVADIGRQLLLKSTANPVVNNGFFLITGVDTVNNAYSIDFRTTDAASVSFPPPETGGATGMQWWLYEKDASPPNTRTSNGGTGYHGYGTSTCSRVILQSPHATAWQVRICCEYDFTTNGAQTCPMVTVAPGFGGNASGDFLVAGKHTHIPLWWDTFNTNAGADPNRVYGVGFGDNTQIYPRRITMGGDDTGQSAFLILRKYSGTGTPNHQFVTFGIPDNEPTPLPVDNTMRLFNWGGPNAANNGNNMNMLWSVNSGCLGMTFGSMGIPVSCSTGLWQYAMGTGQQNQSPIWASNAADSPFISATELFSVDLTAGSVINWSASLPTVLQPDVRYMGTVPFFRAGRTNFPTFSASSDVGKTWFHAINGVFFQYGGPTPVP